jgi:Type II secretory pathway, component PulD
MLRLVLFLLLGLSVCVYPQTAEELQKTAQEQRRTGRVFLNFQDADISLVVKFMSELTGKNIVLDPAVKGTITVSSAKPVSVQTAWEIFLLALSLQGYGVVEEKNYVSIVPLQKATSLAQLKKPSHSGEVIVYIYKAENTQALQLQQAVQPFLSPNAKIAVHTPSNSLIIADVAQNTERLKKILKELDSPEKGLDIKLYKLQKANAESVFQSIQALGSAFQQQLGTPIFITFSKDSNSIVVVANERVQGLIKEIIETLDRESLSSLERNFYLIKLNHISAEELYKSLQTLFGGGLPTTQAVQPQERRATLPDTRGTEILLRREEQKTPQRQAVPLTAIETKKGLRIGFDKGTNSVIIYGTPQSMKA